MNFKNEKLKERTPKSFDETSFEHLNQSYKKAYAPYSKFRVGSVIKFKGNSEVFHGFNIENSAYGSCMCAERVAIFNGIQKLGINSLEWIAVKTNSPIGDFPCGNCLQVISEFRDKDTMIISVGEVDGEPQVLKVMRLDEIYPSQFESDYFKNLQDEWLSQK